MRPGRLPAPSPAILAWILATGLEPLSEAATAMTSFDAIDGSQQTRLVLVGTLLRRDGSDHRDLALISENGNDARWFTIDEAITPKTTLVEVKLRSVLLRHDAEVLELTLSTATAAVADAQEEPAPIPALPAHANALSRSVPGIVPLSENYFRISRELVRDYLHSPEAFQDNQAIFLEEGGLFITRLGNEGILENAGLRVGDVLTAVDGQPLNSLFDLPHLGQVFNSKTLHRIDLEVTRHGAPQRLTYDLSE